MWIDEVVFGLVLENKDSSRRLLLAWDDDEPLGPIVGNIGLFEAQGVYFVVRVVGVFMGKKFVVGNRELDGGLGVLVLEFLGTEMAFEVV